MPSLKVSIPRASLRYFFLLFTHSLWVKDAMDFALTVLDRGPSLTSNTVSWSHHAQAPAYACALFQLWKDFQGLT